MPSVFTKIINHQLQSKIFYETDEVIVIADHRPQAEIHLLIIPKAEYKNFFETPIEVLQMMSETAKLLAEKLGVSDHFRVIINNGWCQEVDHVHYHFLSDRKSDKYIFI